MPLFRLSQRGSGSTVAIGAMKFWITIQTRAGTNAHNQPGGAWSTFVTSWAKIEHIGGKEVVNQTEYAAEVTDRFTLPYVPGITQKMRVTYTDPAGKTHFYDILFVENVDEQSFFVLLLAKEIYSNT